jgi:hypothetical protein
MSKSFGGVLLAACACFIGASLLIFQITSIINKGYVQDPASAHKKLSRNSYYATLLFYSLLLIGCVAGGFFFSWILAEKYI